MRALWKPDVRYPIILAVISLILWAPRLRGSIDLRYDAGVYYILGTSLAEGKGYRLLNEPGEINALQYPPLLPALVAVEQKVLGTSDPAVVGPALRYTYFTIFTIYSMCIYAMARQAFGSGYAFMTALICTMSCDMLFFSDLMQAELPFGLITVLFAISAGLLKIRAPNAPADEPEPPVSDKQSWPRFFLTGSLGSAAFLTRSAGVGLLAAWVGDAFLHKQWKQVALRCAFSAIPFFAWQGWVMHVRHSTEYSAPAYAYQRAPYQYSNVSYVENLLLIDSFKPELGKASAYQIAARIGGNLVNMPGMIGNSVSESKSYAFWPIHWINLALGRPSSRSFIPWVWVDYVQLMLGTLSIAGAVLFAIRKRWFPLLYMLVTVFLVCLTPWSVQFLRYLSPVAPFLVMCMVMSLATLRASFAKIPHPRVAKIGASVLACILGAIPLSQALGDVFAFRRGHTQSFDPSEPNLFYMDDGWVSWHTALKWLKLRAKPGDVVATCAPHMLYLKTGLKAVLPPMEADPQTALDMMDSVPVKYVIVGSFNFLDIDSRYTLPMIENRRESWRLVYQTPDTLTRVYERVHRQAKVAVVESYELLPNHQNHE